MDLRAHLESTRLAGAVATTPGSTVENCGRLVAGDERYTFGLTDWRTASLDEAVEAVRRVCGGDPAGAPAGSPGCIDLDATLGGIERHRRALAAAAGGGAARVLLATGHPTGLLAHYGAIGRALQAHGCHLLAPLDDRMLWPADDGRPRGVRFIDGVAAVTDGGKLLHTHRSRYMEAMLDALDGRADLVVADHGMAGAAIERGIATLSIADVNDPALLLAQSRGRTADVLVIDDNLAPRVFVPVTRAMLDWR
ncbi:MAG TPA: phosphatase [Egibacteraceae bacterium]|nr:phosphatase [Egibacteraceae bacterium]